MMGKTLSLEIPDNLYQQLAVLAQQQGKSAQDLGAQWLAADIERMSHDALRPVAETYESDISNGSEPLEDIENDPLWQACGALSSGIPDLASRHDEYLLKSYTETHDDD